MSDIAEIRLGPLDSTNDLSIASQELADKTNEVIRGLIEIATRNITWDDIEGEFPSGLLQENSSSDILTEEQITILMNTAILLHSDQTRNVHGIANTDSLIVEGDVRLANARTPLPHVASHYAGIDALNLGSIAGELDASKLYGDAELTQLIADFGAFNQLNASIIELGQASFGSTADFTSIGSGAPPFLLSAGSTLVGHLDADKLDGQHGTHYLSRTNHTGQAPVAALSDFLVYPAGHFWTGAQLFDAVAAFNGVAQPFTVASTGIVNNLNAELLNGQLGSYYLDAANLTGTLADERLPDNVALEDVANVFLAAQVVDRAVAGQNVLIFRAAGVDRYSANNLGVFSYQFVAGGGVTARWGEVASGKMGMSIGTHIRTPALEIGTTEVITSARVLNNMTFGGTMRGAAIADAVGGAVIDVEARAALNALLAQRRTRGDQAP
jgi:hypothetical protein